MNATDEGFHSVFSCVAQDYFECGASSNDPGLPVDDDSAPPPTSPKPADDKNQNDDNAIDKVVEEGRHSSPNPHEKGNDQYVPTPSDTATDDSHSVPKLFCCPVTKKPMKDPVVTADGISYERSTAVQLFGPDCKVYPNRALKSLMSEVLGRSTLGSSSLNCTAEGRVKRFTRSLFGRWKGIPPLNDAYYCSMTGNLMHKPTIDPEGHSYNHSAITKRISKTHTSPITLAPLNEDDLYPNNVIHALLLEQSNQSQGSLHPAVKVWKDDEVELVVPTKRSTMWNASLSQNFDQWEVFFTNHFPKVRQVELLALTCAVVLLIAKEPLVGIAALSISVLTLSVLWCYEKEGKKQFPRRYWTCQICAYIALDIFLLLIVLLTLSRPIFGYVMTVIYDLILLALLSLKWRHCARGGLSCCLCGDEHFEDQSKCDKSRTDSEGGESASNQDIHKDCAEPVVVEGEEGVKAHIGETV